MVVAKLLCFWGPIGAMKIFKEKVYGKKGILPLIATSGSFLLGMITGYIPGIFKWAGFSCQLASK